MLHTWRTFILLALLLLLPLQSLFARDMGHAPADSAATAVMAADQAGCAAHMASPHAQHDGKPAALGADCSHCAACYPPLPLAVSLACQVQRLDPPGFIPPLQPAGLPAQPFRPPWA